ARDPREATNLVGREAQLLAPGRHVDELALAQIERPALGGCWVWGEHAKASWTVIGDGRGDRPEIVGVAGVDLLGMVVVRDRREGTESRGVIELERNIGHVSGVRAQGVGLDRTGDVVGVRRRRETAEGIRLVGTRNNVVEG